MLFCLKSRLNNSPFLCLFATFLANLISTNMDKKLNERKIIPQDWSRIERSMRKELPAINKAKLDAAFDDLKSKAATVSGDSLSDWDKESLRLATEYVQDENRDDFRRAINRILKLAGLSPEIEKHTYQQKQAARKKIETKND